MQMRNGNGGGFFRSLFATRHSPKEKEDSAGQKSMMNCSQEDAQADSSTRPPSLVQNPPMESDHQKQGEEGGTNVDKKENGVHEKRAIQRDNWTEEEIVWWCPNDYEKELVKLTWSDDFNFLYELGAAIYTYIFVHNPQAKVLFPKIHQHGDNWKQSADFRSQALKFVQTISFAATNLYHMEECLQPRLFEIGQNHVKYAARGFKPEHWNIFLDAMECALTEHIHSIKMFTSQQCSDATRVWRQLAHYIIVHMKQGYQEEEKKKKKERMAENV